MGAILAMAVKDLRLLVRDRMGAFFAFGFPLVMAVLFGTIFTDRGGDDSRIEIIVVDEDRSAGSAEFVKVLEGASELRVVRHTGEKQAFDRASATEVVRRGGVPAFVAIPKGFGESRESMFFGAGAKLLLGVDPSRKAEQGMLEGLLTKYGFLQLQQSFQDPAIMRGRVKSSMDRLRADPDVPDPTRRVLDQFFGDLDRFLVDLPEATTAAGEGKPAPDRDSGMGGFQPIAIEKAEIVKPARGGPKNAYAISFPQGIIWGVMGCALGFGISLAQERTKGTLMRLLVAPIGNSHVLAGKALGCFIATVSVSLALIALSMAPPFNVRPTSLPLTLAAVLATAVCFVGIMMLLAVFGGASERGGQGLGWGVLLLLAMVGGGMIPLFVMPDWMKSISVVSPVRWAILSIEMGLWRDATPIEMIKPCAILVSIGLVGFAIGAAKLRRMSIA